MLSISRHLRVLTAVAVAYDAASFDTAAAALDSTTSRTARYAMSMAASVWELPAASALAIEIRPNRLLRRCCRRVLITNPVTIRAARASDAAEIAQLTMQLG